MYVPYDLASQHSSVLKAMFDQSCSQNRSSSYLLRGTTDTAIGLLIRWMHNQRIDVCQTLMGYNTQIDHALIALWVLGEQLHIPRLQNAVIIKLAQNQEDSGFCPVSIFKSAWHDISWGGQLHKYMLIRITNSIKDTYSEDIQHLLLPEQ